MSEVFTKIEELATNVKSYVALKIKSAKLSAAEKTAVIISNLAAVFIVVVILVFFIFFAGIALSIVLGEWIGKPWAGFLVVSLLLLLSGFLIWKKRRTLFGVPVMNSLIKQLFENDDEKN